jgi:hypothetical protein
MRPAQIRADAVVDGELPALLSRLTVAVHVVDFGTLVKVSMTRGTGAGLKPG